MVLLNDLVKQWGKCVVAIVASCVDTHARICILSSREDYLFKREAGLVGFVLALLPDIPREALGK
jgi:hypothetical protein